MEAEAPVVFVEPPTLVEVDADVWVVRDYDYPVYYTSGFYWVYRDGIWWRSDMYDKGWAKVEVSVVPQVIVQRDHHAGAGFDARIADGERHRRGQRPERRVRCEWQRGCTVACGWRCSRSAI